MKIVFLKDNPPNKAGDICDIKLNHPDYPHLKGCLMYRAKDGMDYLLKKLSYDDFRFTESRKEVKSLP